MMDQGFFIGMGKPMPCKVIGCRGNIICTDVDADDGIHFVLLNLRGFATADLRDQHVDFCENVLLTLYTETILLSE